MNRNMTKEEIINAGLIALCYGSEEILCYNSEKVTGYTDAEHIKNVPLFNHWFNGDPFKHDFRNIWLIQYDERGIETCSLINY